MSWSWWWLHRCVHEENTLLFTLNIRVFTGCKSYFKRFWKLIKEEHSPLWRNTALAVRFDVKAFCTLKAPGQPQLILSPRLQHYHKQSANAFVHQAWAAGRIHVSRSRIMMSQRYREAILLYKNIYFRMIRTSESLCYNSFSINKYSKYSHNPAGAKTIFWSILSHSHFLGLSSFQVSSLKFIKPASRLLPTHLMSLLFTDSTCSPHSTWTAQQAGLPTAASPPLPLADPSPPYTRLLAAFFKGRARAPLPRGIHGWEKGLQNTLVHYHLLATSFSSDCPHPWLKVQAPKRWLDFLCTNITIGSCHYYVPATVLSTLHAWLRLIFSLTIWKILLLQMRKLRQRS